MASNSRFTNGRIKLVATRRRTDCFHGNAPETYCTLMARNMHRFTTKLCTDREKENFSKQDLA